MNTIPTDDNERAKIRLLDYISNYFPNAHVAKARHSYESNLKHNGGEGMKWAKDKSIGDGNQILRHIIDAMDAWKAGDKADATYHLTCLAWRGDELLERMLTGMEPFNDIPTIDSEELEDVYQSNLAEQRRIKERKFIEYLNDGYGGMGEGDEGVPFADPKLHDC
jgi:hemerythrin-like domain-containing protein